MVSNSHGGLSPFITLTCTLIVNCYSKYVIVMVYAELAFGGFPGEVLYCTHTITQHIVL